MNANHPNQKNSDIIKQHEVRVNSIYSRRSQRYQYSHSLWTLCVDRRWRKMTALAIEKPMDVILDIGSGTGLTSAKILELGKAKTVVGLDLNFDMLSRSRYNEIPNGIFAPVNGNALQLPFRDNTFGGVVSMLGMGGIFDAELAYREIFRVVKNGGLILTLEMCTPKNPFLRFLHKHVTERMVNRYWGFRDIDIEGIVRRLGLQDYKLRYRNDMLLGSVYQLQAIVNK